MGCSNLLPTLLALYQLIVFMSCVDTKWMHQETREQISEDLEKRVVKVELSTHGAWTLQITEGVIVSPGYPDYYPDNVDVLLKFPPYQNPVTLLISPNVFALENYADFLSFGQMVNNEPQELAKFTGKDFQASAFKGNQLYLKFKSDSLYRDQGFHLNFKIIENEPTNLDNNIRVYQKRDDFETTTYAEITEMATDEEPAYTQPQTTEAATTRAPSSSTKAPVTCGLPAIIPCLPSPSSNSKCPKDRIIGGREALPNSYPWQVALVSASGSFFCGGSIVHEGWVITAAHCVTDSTAATVKVVVGAHSPNDKNQVAVTQVIVHPNYNPSTSDNDIALLKLSKPLAFNSYISPVCVAKPSDVEVETTTPVVATGWGTMGDGTLATLLQEVQLTLTTNSACDKSYSGGITAQMICASGPGKDTCQGDSGGPLVYRNAQSGRFTLIGATSFGQGCADPKFPGVYARVSAFHNWFAKYIPNL